MYINDVIRSVKNAYPSEYDTGEMYKWCDEVSSMLTEEDRPTYHRVVLPVGKDGSVLLPQGVKTEYVTKVCAGKLILNYTDMRMYGGRDIYIKGMNGIRIENQAEMPQTVTVDYQKPYRPIRLVKYYGDYETTDNTLEIYPSQFVAGDSIVMSVDGETDEVYSDIPVLSVDVTDDASGDLKHVLTVPDGTFENISSSTGTANIMRIVTDRTVCDAPFDSMYIDYILAKINLYQHNTNDHNTYMTLFNSRLSAYKEWLIKRMPSGDERFKNWW